MKISQRNQKENLTARVAARPGMVGEEITTVMVEGHTETKNAVKAAGDMVVKTRLGEQHIINAKTFAKRCEVDPSNPKQYRPKGGAQESIKISQDIEFKAPWGEYMTLKSSGFLSISGRETSDIYGIQQKEFNHTYSKCDKNGNIIPLPTNNRER